MRRNGSGVDPAGESASTTHPHPWRWPTQRFARRLMRRVRSQLYRDPHRDVSRAVFIAGTARSGTTWVGELLASQLHIRMMFEPFHPGKVHPYRRYSYFQYMRPDANDPQLAAFCELVFSGVLRNAWVDREVNCWSARSRVIKEIRANLLLGWIRANFPQLPIVLVLRHPCAVVSSRLRLGWATDSDLEPMLRQSALRADFLDEHMVALTQARSPAAKHAAIWCIHNLVPLRQFSSGDVCTVFYEHLCARPEVAIPHLFQATGSVMGARAFRAARTPSLTATATSPSVTGRHELDGWKRHLMPAEIRDVLDTVDGFGLGHLYGAGIMPLKGTDAVARAGDAN